MAITVEEFRLRFPEFADETEYPNLRIQLFLDDAAIIYMGSDEGRWCNKYNIAQAYLAAHLLTSATKTEAGDANTSAGPITSKTAGGVSVTRASNSSANRSDGDDFFYGTSYGQQFIIMRNTCFVAVMVPQL